VFEGAGDFFKDAGHPAGGSLNAATPDDASVGLLRGAFSHGGQGVGVVFFSTCGSITAWSTLRGIPGA